MKTMSSIILILMLSIIVSPGELQSDCQQANKNHTDKHITRCAYSQKDLRKMHKKCPERYNNIYCFYCGCPKELHTQR